ncbi:hypothetical protein [Aeromonas rivipollensis]|uniref:Uncharacterized protein n=1 Tax=Aeromonas rivipollensis TaxID=948519 RepID=A0AAW9YBY5_9GAMM|nr:hypothetical protein [Aeromonas rivipollensis]NEX75070.1 hypothetical protein [Aeromonas rivipollensis]
MKLKFDIKTNAIDSFNEALSKYDQGQNGDLKSFKFAITHLAHCIELVLKMYLQTLNENLVFSSCYKKVSRRSNSDNVDLLSAFNALESEGFDFESLIKGHKSPHTVTVEQALSLAKCEVCGITGNDFVDQNFIDDINWMKELRNSIEHFEFEFTAKEVRLCIGRLVRGLVEFTDIFSLFDFDKEVGEERTHVFKVLVDEYEHALSEANITISEQKKLLFAGVRLKHQMFIEWNIYTCPTCGNNTMIPNDDSSTGYRCTLEGCENEESEDIEMDCDICGTSWPNGEMTSWEGSYSNVCPRCENPEAW